jgi:hypothetical protein
MKKIVFWVMLAIFSIGSIMMKGQQLEATDYTNSTLPVQNTTELIEEEKDEEETNVTSSTDVKRDL